MKKLIILLGGCLCILLLSSGIRKKTEYPRITTTPSKLQLFVNEKTDPYTIKVAYTLNIPGNLISTCARLVYQPYFLAVDHRYNLTPLVISGRENIRQEKRLEALTGKQAEYPDAMHLESAGDGMKIRLSEIVPFEVWMTESKLRADIILEACDRERHLEVLTLADGVIWFPLAPGPALVRYVKEKAKVAKVSRTYFIYPSGSSVFNRGYDGNAERMKKMMSLIDSLQKDTSMHLEKIVITGSCSPTGSVAYNTRLAEQRAENMKQRFIQRKGLDQQLIKLQPITFDWEGFQKQTEQSKLQNKEAILHILDGNYSILQRKELLCQLPQYEYLKTHVFPDLQKVTCTFYYTQEEEITKILPE